MPRLVENAAFVSFSLMVFLLAAGRCGSARAITPPGIVYEAEAISEPRDAWIKNASRPDRWTLWTTEANIAQKRSGGAVLCSPVVAHDRQSPEEGAPPLRSIVRDLKPGAYLVYVSPPGRPLGYSLDGKNWFRHEGGELALGLKQINGPFELWVDDRYAHPAGNPGPAYYDYIRFVHVPADALGFQAAAAWSGLEYWLRRGKRGFGVPAYELKTEGCEFNLNRGCVLCEKAGGRFSYTFAASGTYYLAVQVQHAPGAAEELLVTLGDHPLGRVMPLGPEIAGPVLYSRQEPFTVRPGERLVCTAAGAAPLMVDALFFSPQPIRQPDPAIENIETWSPEPGVAEVCWTTSQAVAGGAVQYEAAGQQKTAATAAGLVRNHRVRLERLDAAATYQGRVTVTTSAGQTITSEPFAIRAAAPAAPATRPLVIPLDCGNASAGPALVGMPFAQGTVARTSDLRLFDAASKPVPLQADLFSRWPDGSVKWATLSFQAHSTGGHRLEARPTWPTAESTPPLLKATPSTAGWRLATDALTVDVVKAGPLLLDRVSLGQGLQTRGGCIEVATGDGTQLHCGAPMDFQVEANGPVRAVVRMAGPMVDRAGRAAWRYLVRLTFWRGESGLTVDLSLNNDQPTPRFRPLKSLEFVVPLAGTRRSGSLEGGTFASLSDKAGMSLLQDRDNRFHLHAAGNTTDGQRAQGMASVEDDGVRLTVAVRDFWQTYPKGLVVDGDALRVQLLPPLPKDAFDDPQARKDRWLLYSWFDQGNYLFRAGQLTRHEFRLHWARSDRDDVALNTWGSPPRRPQAPAAYLCGTRVLGRALFPGTPGVWDLYERFFADSFTRSNQDIQHNRTYGWMHYGDWFGERDLNYGNNEYDQGWALAVQWMRSGRRDYFDRGLAAARQCASVDTLHGPFTEALNGLVFEHSFDHVGTDFTPEQLGLDPRDRKVASYLKQYGTSMFRGAIDRQGHVFQEGNWIYAALTGDGFLRDVANRVCTNQAEKLTPNFDFGIERAGGWPLINAVAAYRTSGNPFYLNAARLMVQRCLERQDPARGGWLHFPPLSETGDEVCRGGKAFATGILSYAVLRYLDEEPRPRPEVRQMLVRVADWLIDESWQPGKGFRYISNCAKYKDAGGRGMTSLLNAEIAAFAAQETGQSRYRDFWVDMIRGELTRNSGGMGKTFAQAVRQTIFGVDRARELKIDPALVK